MFITGWHFFNRSLFEVVNSMYSIWDFLLLLNTLRPISFGSFISPSKWEGGEMKEEENCLSLFNNIYVSYKIKAGFKGFCYYDK